MPELQDHVVSFEQAVGELDFWGSMPMVERDRAFSDLIGWVAGRAILGEPGAADTLRRIRDRAER